MIVLKILIIYHNIYLIYTSRLARGNSERSPLRILLLERSIFFRVV